MRQHWNAANLAVAVFLIIVFGGMALLLLGRVGADAFGLM
jgi:hypothetical protein